MAVVDLAALATGFLKAGEDGRRHLLIGETEDWNAWLIDWTEGIHRGWHDHGESTGVFHVLSGCLVEERHGTRRVLRPGSTTGIPRGVVHDVWGAVPGTFGIHVYSPPLTVMRFFDDRGMFTHAETVEARR